MKIQTRYFGEVDVEKEKILHFEQGLFGFEEYTDYTILYDLDRGEDAFFSWLQSVQEKTLAFVIVNPFKVRKDFDPVVETELLAPLGEYEPQDLLAFVLATVPSDPQKTTVNLKAPLIINQKNRQGVQIVAENEDYDVRCRIMSEENGR